MKAYKGFKPDMTCRGFQYKEGGEYETAKAKVCESGFHACLHPLDCFDYYEPGQSVYHEVDLDGKIDDHGVDDTKVAATKIKIGARLDIAGLVKAAIDFVMSKVKPGATADEDHGLASERGYNSAASATGDNSAASATGDKSAASADNPTAIAVAWGVDSKAKGVKGAHIVLSEWHWDSDKCEYILFASQMVCINGEKYKADTWYALRNGEVVEVAE